MLTRLVRGHKIRVALVPDWPAQPHGVSHGLSSKGIYGPVEKKTMQIRTVARNEHMYSIKSKMTWQTGAAGA